MPWGCIVAALLASRRSCRVGRQRFESCLLLVGSESYLIHQWINMFDGG